VDSFKPQLVYPWYLHNTELHGPHSHSGDNREKKIVCPAENETPIPQSTILWPSNCTGLYQLLDEPAASKISLMTKTKHSFEMLVL
jgi:hypothetical protein